MSAATRLVTFSVGDHAWGIDVQSVQEILKARSLTPVPLADASVAGLLNLRGQIVTVIDLRRRLGLDAGDAAPPEGEAMNVVVRTAAGPVSLRVDTIGDVIDVDDASFEPPPRSVRGHAQEFVLGLHKLEGRILHVLSVDKVADFASHARKGAQDNPEGHP